jgi:hypothetical protein
MLFNVNSKDLTVFAECFALFCFLAASICGCDSGTMEDGVKCLLFVLLSCSCYNESSHPWQLKTGDIYSLVVLEARNLQPLLLAKTCSLLLPASGDCWCPLTCGHMAAGSVPWAHHLPFLGIPNLPPHLSH